MIGTDTIIRFFVIFQSSNKKNKEKNYIFNCTSFLGQAGKRGTAEFITATTPITATTQEYINTGTQHHSSTVCQ